MRASQQPCGLEEIANYDLVECHCKGEIELDCQAAQANRIRLLAIRNGQAIVKVIEGLQTLKGCPCSWRERLLINLTLSLYQHRLRQAVKVLPADMAGEILSAGANIGNRGDSED